MKQEIERCFQEIEKSNLHNTEVAALQIKHLKTIVKEYNKRTGSQVIAENRKNKQIYLTNMSITYRRQT